MSVEANTRSDAQEFLELARRLKLKTYVTVRKLEEANEALLDFKNGKIDGAFVLDCKSESYFEWLKLRKAFTRFCAERTELGC